TTPGTADVIATVAPVVTTGAISSPLRSAATPPEREMSVEVLIVDAEIVSCTVATTPLKTVVLFRPYTTQTTEARVGLQAMVLPALIAPDPAVTLIEEISAVE